MGVLVISRFVNVVKISVMGRYSNRALPLFNYFSLLHTKIPAIPYWTLCAESY